MGFDGNVCETGLRLGLGFSVPSVEIIPAKSAGQDHSNYLSRPAMSFEPTLTLGLVSGCEKVISVNKQSSGELLYRQDSGASSFSNVSVKRERDHHHQQQQLGSEETETTARVASRVVSDDDDDGSNGRKKLRLTKAQSALLEESFKQHSTLNPKQKQELARELNLRPRQVEVWFQNRRARTKLKQTEVDCEYLKKCCETLTDENRKLQKEVQELKALKVAQPLYMQLPAATLTMCPSCERVGGNNNNNNNSIAASPAAAPPADTSSKDRYSNSISPSSHFYNSFPNPSAAC